MLSLSFRKSLLVLLMLSVYSFRPSQDFSKLDKSFQQTAASSDALFDFDNAPIQAKKFAGSFTL